MENVLVWNEERTSGTSLRDWLDEAHTDRAILALEAVAQRKGEWEMNDYGAWDWWGLSGTFNGETFTVYTHKSGTIKIGGFEGLDVQGLKKALQEIVKDDMDLTAHRRIG